MAHPGSSIVPLKVISGGQTGVDRAALDAALMSGLSVGGWCPKGRRACDGIIPDQYSLVETASPEYSTRTELNVRDSNGTLVLASTELGGGTLLTVKFAQIYAKPLLIINLDAPVGIERILYWLHDEKIAVLNVAGPRETPNCPCYQRALCYLTNLFRAVSDS